MKKSVFAKWFLVSCKWCVVSCLLTTLVWSASSSVRAASAMVNGGNAPAGDSPDVIAIKQIGQDMGDAMVAGDINKLSQIYAEDWASVDSSGTVITKRTMLTDFKSFHDKLESFELGPIDVQVYGDVAVANGTVKEKRSLDGKDTSGKFAYVDLLRKREGKWVVVRSAAARVK